MTIKFEKAFFIKSVLSNEEFPRILSTHGIPLDEIALIGKSNVGKSSLINHLLKKDKLAKVSAKPGKTQTINFFNVDEKIALVDLPGYGFAKVPKELKEKWSIALDHYLKTRSSLKLLVILLDCRHKPSKEDIELILWANAYDKPFIVILTKFDKLRAKERKPQREKLIKELMLQTRLSDFTCIPYSIENIQMRQILINTINNHLKQLPCDPNEATE